MPSTRSAFRARVASNPLTSLVVCVCPTFDFPASAVSSPVTSAVVWLCADGVKLVGFPEMFDQVRSESLAMAPETNASIQPDTDRRGTLEAVGVLTTSDVSSFAARASFRPETSPIPCVCADGLNSVGFPDRLPHVKLTVSSFPARAADKPSMSVIG